MNLILSNVLTFDFPLGVGKSKTINTCSQWAEALLRRAGPYLPRVLILGPTGASAALIGNTFDLT